MTNPEPQKSILTHRGKVEKKAPKHYDASVKKPMVHPLVMTDAKEGVKLVEKRFEPRNPIEEIIKGVKNRYSGEYAIVRETMQNAERISRDRRIPVDIEMTFTPTKFQITDNAGGVTKKTIDTVFNIGQSGYETLDSSTGAFGQGFWSFVLLFGKVEVISNDIDAEFDFDDVESRYLKDKKFDLNKAYKALEAMSLDEFNARGKFIAIFTKPKTAYNYENAIRQAKTYAKTLPVRSITINGELANNKIDFSKTPHGYMQVQKTYGDKIGIEGYFVPSTHDDAIRLYFQGLPVGSASATMVDNRYHNLPSIRGDININTTFYGRPSENRDSWIQDDNIKKMENIVTELARKNAIDLVKYGTDAQIEDLQHFISHYTTFEDIKYAIHFEVISAEVMDLITKSERAKHQDFTEQQFKDYMSELLASKSKLNDAIESAKNYNIHIDVKEYNKQKEAVLEEKKEVLEQTTYPEVKQDFIDSTKDELKEIEEAKQEQQKQVVEAKKSIDDLLESRDEGGYTAAKWKKHTYWLKRADSDRYADSVANARYHHIPLAFADNKFQAQLFNNLDNFHHISEFNASVTNVPKLSNAGARNSKERRLEYILKVFMEAAGHGNIKIIIADIDFKTVIQVPHSNVKIEKPMSVGAYANPAEQTIYLQRRMSFGNSDGGEANGFIGVKSLYPFFDYNQYDVENKSIGQGDIAVFSKVRKLLVHELAHAARGTTDDTPEHYKAMLQLDAEFDDAIAKFKASSDLIKGDDIKQKVRTQIGADKSDTIVATYTKGSSAEMEKTERPVIAKAIKPPTKLSLFYDNTAQRYYTYGAMLEKGNTPEEINKLISSDEVIPIGYKIGDYVQVKLRDEVSNAVIVKTSSYSLLIKYDDGIEDYVTHKEIVGLSNITPPAKPKDDDIFYDETLYARKYSMLKEIAKDGQVDMSYYMRHYKPSGLRIGDTVTTPDNKTGKILMTSYGDIVVTFPDDSRGSYKAPHLVKVQSPSTTNPSPQSGKMRDTYEKIKFFLKTYPLSTNRQIIDGVPELAEHNNSDKFLWNILNAFGKEEIERTDDRPQRLKLRGT